MKLPQRSIPSVAFVAALFFANLSAGQTLSVSVFFGEGSVWQRDQPVALRGRGPANATLTLESDAFGALNTVIDSTGAWILPLSPKPAAGPFDYSLRAGKQTLDVGNVYIGDVVICSGQSNMEWPLDATEPGPAKLAASQTDTRLRHLYIPHTASNTLRNEPDPAAMWQSAHQGRTEGFTAIGYFVAARLREEFPDVAVGIINVSWGGSRIEAWLPNAGYADHVLSSARDRRATVEELRSKYPGAFDTTAPRLPTQGSGGQPIEVTAPWEQQGFPGVDGVIWYDNRFQLSDRQLGGAANIVLGRVDDTDSTFVNGHFVGSVVDGWDQVRRYTIDPKFLRAGVNTVSVRVHDHGGGGGISAGAEGAYVDSGAGEVSLNRGWTARPERIIVDTAVAADNETPRYLYNGMLHPLCGVAARGVLWYQGESNGFNLADATSYGAQITELVRVFRTNANQPDLPFVAVELPEFQAFNDEPYALYEHWPLIRQSTRAILDLPNTSTVVALGYGEAGDIHPRRKQPVAQMMAEELLRLAYDQQDSPRNSLPLKLEPVGQAMLVTFDSAGRALETTDGEAIRGFALQDTDGRWHHASAQLVGDYQVRLTGPPGHTFEAAAYAWANNPAAANLANASGRRVGSFELTINQ